MAPDGFRADGDAAGPLARGGGAAAPAASRAVPRRRPGRADTCLLVSPYGQAGGGMGRAMTYLMEAPGLTEAPEASGLTEAPGAPGLAGAPDGPSLRLLPAESRGGGRAALSPLHAARVAARMAWLRLCGRLALVHLNVAERGSVWRKGALLLCARLLGVPVLLHLHAAQVIAFHAGLGPLRRRLVALMFRGATRVVVLGEPWRRWVEGLGVAPERVAVVRNGVPRPPHERVAPMPGAPFRLLFLGNLSARKGVPELLEAMRRPELAGVRLRLTLAGGNAEPFRASVAALGGRAVLAGWLDAGGTAAALADADALVLPSHDEGLPLVVLEALGLGLPVITTPVGAIPEVLRDGETALLVPPGDAAALAAAVARLAADPALCARLSRAGLALYEREFTVARFARRLRAQQRLCLPGGLRGG